MCSSWVVSTILVPGNRDVNKAGSILALGQCPLWKETSTEITKNKLPFRIYNKNNIGDVYSFGSA